MKLPLISLCLTACFALLACDDREEEPAGIETTTGEFYDSARNSVESVGDSLENSWSEVSNYAADQKDAFMANLEEGLDEVDELIASGREEVGEMAGETEGAKEAALDEMEEARDELEAALQDAREATAEGWEAAKARVAEAWDRLQAAVSDYDEIPDENESSPDPAPAPY